MEGKVFLSYKFTGLEQSELEHELCFIQDIVEGTGAELFCSLFMEDTFDKMGLTIEQRYKYCTDAQAHYDVVLSFLNHREPSKGMIVYELLQAKQLQQPMILLVRDELQGLDDFRELEEYACIKRTFSDLGALQTIIPESLDLFYSKEF